MFVLPKGAALYLAATLLGRSGASWAPYGQSLQMRQIFDVDLHGRTIRLWINVKEAPQLRCDRWADLGQKPEEERKTPLILDRSLIHLECQWPGKGAL
jgi:hypothetical protein